jgi:hypothetical protein
MIKLRSPAFWLGVFFFFRFSLPVFGEEAVFSSGGGTLWVDGEHSSGYVLGSLSLSGDALYGAIGAGSVFSDFPALDADYLGVWFNGGIKPASLGFPLGFDLTAGLLQREELNAQIPGGDPISSNSADGYFLNLALPLRFGDWNASPSVFFGRGNWGDGEFYWFFGKPHVPDLLITGFSAAYQEEHHLYFYYLSLNLEILNPSNVELFSSHFDGLTAAYRFRLDRRSFSLGGTAGWLFAGGSLNGSLTSGNQGYFLFPYSFYDIDFDARLHAVFGVLEASYRRDIFRLNMFLGAVQVLSGNVDADIHSKQKKLSFLGIPIYDGREEFFTNSLDLRGLGAAFLSIEGGIESLRLGRNKGEGSAQTGPLLSLNLRKLFAIPWGCENLKVASFFGDEGDRGGAPMPAENINFASILLSGLSFYCTIVW